MSEWIGGDRWGSTPLGAPEDWPLVLRTVVGIMLESSQAMFVTWGPERRMLYNVPYAEVLGSKHPDALGEPFSEVWSELSSEVLPCLDGVYAGKPGSMDVLHRTVERHGHSERIDLRFSCTPLRDADGRVAGVFGIGQEVTAQVLAQGMTFDITEIRRTQEALRESEARFREMADGLPLIIWVHNAAGEQELVNRTFCEFFGVNREDMTGRRWQMLMHPDDAEQYSREFFECMRERRPFHGETRVKRADGQWRWLESWGRPRFTAQGEFRGFIGTSADVTDRKEAEAARRQSEQRFRMLADNMAQLAWIADEHGSVFWYNKRWFDYTGTTLEQARGRGWTQLHHPDHVQRVTYRLERCFESGEPWEDVFPLRGKDGTYRWFLARALPIRDASNRVSCWFGTKTDVTAQREAEEQLRASDRQKDEFFAMLGHELRNPLAAIRSASELLKLRNPDDPLLQRTQGVLERQSTHMARLIDGLLEVSRMASGRILLERETLDLRKVVEIVLQDRSAEMAKRQLECEKELPEKPLWVLGDQVRLAQVFDNLVANAIKFSEPGGRITVAAHQEQSEAVVRVADTGVGIRQEILPRIFEPFQQEEQGIARSAGGLGVGLALVKGLVELHGGRIEARSGGPGTGAVFEARLPLTAGGARAGKTGQAGAPPQRSVLIVEDNTDAAGLLRELLEIQGHRARVANDGYQALEALREQSADVVLCDLGLPGMSGYELARQIREDTSLRPIRIVALTGYGQPADRRRTREFGFDAHLTKPVDLAAIEAVLGEISSTA